MLKTTAAITLAVFLPTPGNVCSLSISEGTSPLKSLNNFLAIPTRCLALLFGYETLRISSKTASGEATAKTSGEGYALNRAGVIILTLLSVH